VIIILFLWIVNFAISWLNAWGCGKSWNETKHVGGIAHFMNWMGAIMSACGFTWCYLLILGFGGAYVPLIEQDDGTMTTLLDPPMLEAFMNLGYLVIIGPILGSGIAITLQSWGHFWRRRSLGSGAVAGWNTYAQVYNTASALQHVPVAASGLGDFFKGSDSDNGRGTIVIVMVALALFGGVLTTYWILTKTARSTASSRFYAHTLKT
jgi:hypothetical protein